VNEDGEPCKFVLSNKYSVLKCKDHPNGNLVSTGPCEAYFVYVAPKDRTDHRRWFGLLKPGSDENPAMHSHPKPFLSKIPEKLQQDLAKAIADDPTISTADLSKGYGIGYNPSSASVVASDQATLGQVYELDQYDFLLNFRHFNNTLNLFFRLGYQ